MRVYKTTFFSKKEVRNKDALNFGTLFLGQQCDVVLFRYSNHQLYSDGIRLQVFTILHKCEIRYDV